MNSSKDDKIKIEIEDNGIAILTLIDIKNDNALSHAMVEDLMQNLTKLSHNEKVKVLIITNSGGKFCTGADKSVLLDIAQGKVSPSDINLPKYVIDLPFPVIAAIRGDAIGGGLAFGILADIILIAKEYRYGFTFMNMGFTPGMASTKLALQCINQTLLNELLYTGRCIKGKDFVGRSSFNAILPKDEIYDKAYDIALQIADKPLLALKTLKLYLSLEKKKIFQETKTIESFMHEITFKKDTILKEIKDGFY